MRRNLSISKRSVALASLVLMAFCLAVFQPFGYSPDFKQYESFFQEVRSYADDIRSVNRFEPGFFYLSAALSTVIRSDVLLYGCFVAVAIALKLFYAFKDSSGYYFWLGAAFYFVKFFPLLELTQLRAALGSAFMLAALSYVFLGRFYRGVFAGLIGTMFHYSVLLVLPFFFLPALKRWQSIALAIVIFAVLYLFSAYFIEAAGIRFSVFESYGDFSHSVRPLNRFSPVFFPEFFIIFCSLIYWKDLSLSMQRIVCIEMIGFAMFYAFADYGVVATRGRELFSILWLYFVLFSSESNARIKFCVNIFVFCSILLYFYIFFVSGFFVDASQWNE